VSSPLAALLDASLKGLAAMPVPRLRPASALRVLRAAVAAGGRRLELLDVDPASGERLATQVLDAVFSTLRGGADPRAAWTLARDEVVTAAAIEALERLADQGVTSERIKFAKPSGPCAKIATGIGAHVAITKPWDEFPYKVFISYSHTDVREGGQAWGEWLESRMEAYRIPKELVGKWTPFGLVPVRIAPVFRDRSSLGAGSSLADSLRNALDSSATLLVICSPSAARSSYIDEEVRYFKRQGRSGRVFALIVHGTPGDPERECFPPSLRFRVHEETGELTEERDEPIAADARAEGDGPEQAFLKLVAGLLGVDLTALEQKTNEILAAEARNARRLRNIFAVLAAVSLAAAISAGIAIRSVGYLKSQTIASAAEDAYNRGYYDRALKIAGAASRGNLFSPVSVDAVIQLGRAIQASRTLAHLEAPAGTMNAIDITPDGAELVSEVPPVSWTPDPFRGKRSSRCRGPTNRTQGS
jgi:MTH538 TIR-like domain (DUF1863)